MATLTALDPLVEQLMEMEGKAEIVNGKIQATVPTGTKTEYAGFRR